MKELDFLKIIENSLSDSSFLGDDCAYLEDFGLAISTDSLIEDVHFSCSLMNPFEIGKKALLVNISDILASGAKPNAALVSLGGELDNYFVENFYKGINQVSSEFGVKIVGGDLVKSDKIAITITILGDCKNRKVSSRKNAQNGYVVALCGEFGSSAQGFFDLNNGICDNYYTKIHKSPILYPEVSTLIAKTVQNPYAMMDSSDGLIDCLFRIAQASKLKIEVDFNKIPKKTSNREFVLYGGEDYSLVCCLAQSDFRKIDGLVKIGVCRSGDGVFVDGEKVQYGGFSHFE